MAATRHEREDLKGTTYELFMLAVSVLSIVNLGLLAAFTTRSQSWWLVIIVDTGLTVIFLADFLYRFTTARSKLRYMGRGGGVLDLLACVPALRIFRLFRIVRAVRIIRRLGGPRVVRELRQGLASGTLYLVVFLGVLTLEVAGLLELHFEQHAPGANITTGGDAIWWGYVTATTVGYGDQYPVTKGGRVVGVFMLTVGVALFATFSGFLANVFLSSRRSEKGEPAPPGSIQSALSELDRLADEQRRATAELRARLAELEATRA